jgi:hypothetical protein
LSGSFKMMRRGHGFFQGGNSPVQIPGEEQGVDHINYRLINNPAAERRGMLVLISMDFMRV